MQGIGFRFSHTALVAVSLAVVLSLTTSGRAGEGTEKTPRPAKAPKPCFTLLNANQIPADATPLARLNSARVKVHWNPNDGTTLRQVFTDLGRTIGVPVVIMPKAEEMMAVFEKKWGGPDEVWPIDGTLKDIPARGYLEYLLYLLDGLVWEVRDGSLVVGSCMESSWDAIETRVHPLGKLVEPDCGFVCLSDRGGDSGLCSSRNEVANLITYAIYPRSWVGDDGTISVMELSGAKALVVRNRQDVQEQIVSLLHHLPKMLDSKEKYLEVSLDEAAAQCFARAMQKKVTLDVEEIRLSDFVAELEKQIGESILLDVTALERIGLRVNESVTCRCKEKPLRWVAEHYLRILELAWSSRFGVLELTTQAEVERYPATSIYDVTDLTKYSVASGDFDFGMNSLIELILCSVDPCAWNGMGDIGEMWEICFEKRGRSFLVARESQSTRDIIRQLLTDLRAIRDKKIKSSPLPSKADRLVTEKLNKRLKWDIEKGTTLADFLADLKKRLDIEIQVDQFALEDIGVYQDELTLGPIHIDNFSAGSLLTLLLEPGDMAWMVRHGEVFISTVEEFELNLVTKVYEVSDLAIVADTQGYTYYDLDSLMELITSTIDPGGWQEVGGPGSISPYGYPDGGHVVAIRQTYQIHQEVTKLFNGLRAVMPKEPVKWSPPPVRSYPWFHMPLKSHGEKPKDEKSFMEKLPPLHPKQMALVESNNAFAVKLYEQMAKQQDGAGQGGQRVVRSKSFCFSPYSIAALTQAIKVGTRGNTDCELENALCLTLSGDELHGAYGSLLTSLMSDTPSPINQSGNFGSYDMFKRVSRKFDLTVANRIWIQKEYGETILPEFPKNLERYLMGVEELDFANQRLESSQRINEWIHQETKGRIKQMVSLEDLSSQTRFVGVNAVFFQGRWIDTFSPNKTDPEPFYDSDGRTLLGSVPMMKASDEEVWFARDGGVSIFRKQYVGEASFFILLPPPGEGELEKLEASLSYAKLHKWAKKTMPHTFGRIQIPKFEIESTFPMIDVMKQFGVKDLFDAEKADFSGMLSQEGFLEFLYVGLLRHKATIKVDEVGTVATGATMAGGYFGGPMDARNQSFIANRPFLFLVFDEKTSSLLFMGRYMGPEKVAE